MKRSRMKMPEIGADAITDKLKAAGLRITPQRIAILGILSQSKDHPTVEEIHSEVKRTFPMMSLATVYKTVSSLKESGLILEIAGRSGKGSRYDGYNNSAHPHLICNDCGSILDLDICDHALNDLKSQVEDSTGYKIMYHELTYRGICPECEIKAG